MKMILSIERTQKNKINYLEFFIENLLILCPIQSSVINENASKQGNDTALHREKKWLITDQLGKSLSWKQNSKAKFEISSS
jgi:hypothetical protein